MNILASMVTYLKGHPGLSAYVGDRVYGRRLRSGSAYPAVVYQRISRATTYTQQGSDRLPTMRVQFVIWDTDPGRLIEAGDELIRALEAMRLGGPTFVENAFDREDSIALPGGQRADGYQVDAMIMYRE